MVQMKNPKCKVICHPRGTSFSPYLVGQSLSSARGHERGGRGTQAFTHQKNQRALGTWALGSWREGGCHRLLLPPHQDAPQASLQYLFTIQFTACVLWLCFPELHLDMILAPTSF
jgi:hypothetical protein